MQTALRFPFPRRLERNSHSEFAFLERRLTPRSVFMEVGGADCRLAIHAANYVERVYAVDVSGRFLQSVLVPLNLRLVLCDGVRIPLQEASVDLAFSGGFVDQLHPDDKRAHLRAVLRSLVPGGQYVLRTAAMPSQLRREVLEAGFGAVACYAGALRVPWSLGSLVPNNLLRIAATR
jgi:SAM-dependent methyltransferase